MYPGVSFTFCKRNRSTGGDSKEQRANALMPRETEIRFKLLTS